MLTLTDIPMPQMGESITEASIVKWHKAVGDEVAADETLLEISTAKVEAEIPAPADGVVAEVLFEEGDTVDVDVVIARLAPPGTDVSDLPGRKAAPKEAPAEKGETLPRTNGSVSENRGPSTQDLERERQKMLRRRSTPLVRSMARELGLNIEDIPGTGRHGRVTKTDVLRFLSERDEAGRSHRGMAVTQAQDSETLSGTPLTFGEDLGDLVEPMTAMRKAIARHMVESHHTSPHAYTVHEVDFTRTMALRNREKDRFQGAHGVKLTPLAFILKALTDAIIRYPIFNASVVEGDRIAYHRAINIGVAVALENGLIVPVIRNLENKSVADIAGAINDVASRARKKQLKPADVEGGTITVTSPGQQGALMGLPILNQPQVAVLYVGAIKKRPCVIESPDGDVIGIRSTGILSLGLDHRVIDGWVADSFMVEIKEALEKAEFELE